MKSSGVSYLLWLLSFVGFFGMHRFYNGKWITGGLFLIGQFVDLFLIPAMTQRANFKTRVEFVKAGY